MFLTFFDYEIYEKKNRIEEYKWNKEILENWCPQYDFDCDTIKLPVPMDMIINVIQTVFSG